MDVNSACQVRRAPKSSPLRPYGSSLSPTCQNCNCLSIFRTCRSLNPTTLFPHATLKCCRCTNLSFQPSSQILHMQHIEARLQNQTFDLKTLIPKRSVARRPCTNYRAPSSHLRSCSRTHIPHNPTSTGYSNTPQGPILAIL